MGYWLNGMMQMSADKPVLLPGDVKGQIFRVRKIRSAGGATTKQKAFKDVYRALITGEVNGQENTWSYIYTKRFFEAQDSIIETDHSYLGYVVLFSAKFWNALTDKDRTELQQIFNEVTAARNHLVEKINNGSRQKVIDAGGIVHALSKMQRAA